MKFRGQNDETDVNRSEAEPEAIEQPTTDAGSTDDLIDVINQQQTKINDLISTLQRTRADFENYRKHTDADLARAAALGEEKTVKKLLPIIDVLDTAMTNVPAELKDNAWVHGIEVAHRNVGKAMTDIKLTKIATKAGDDFNHDIHDAIQFEDGEGEREVVADVLRPGYTYNGRTIRQALVKVTKAE